MIAQKIAGFIAPMGVVLVAEACSSSPTTTPTSNLVEPSGETPSFLFVAQGTSGTLEAIEGCPDTFLLTIDDPGPGVTVFSDRPSRLAFNIPVSEFVDNWAVYGFVEDPPNAAAVLAVAEPDTDVMIVELENPVWTEETAMLTFDATAIGG